MRAEAVTEEVMIEPALLAPGSGEWRSLTPVDGSVDSGARGDVRQALLSALQMQHLVVLAGSGCSIAAGGPSMGDLWNRVVGPQGIENAEAVLGLVNHNPADRNVEALMSRLEAYLSVMPNSEAESFLVKAKEAILAECSGFLDRASLRAHQVFLHRLSRRRVRDQRLKIFTTNYDLCFERAASDIGGVALDGFSFTSPRRYDPRYFDYDIVRRPKGGDDNGDYLEGVFLLHKVHGSVNWAKAEDGGIRESQAPDPGTACLIYPATGKYQQSFAQPHLESVAQYLAAVRQPNTCVLTVGFGFNDNHLTEPLMAAVISNPHLRLVIVDPAAKEMASNNEHPHWPRLRAFSDQGEDVWFLCMGFAELAEVIPDLKSLSPAASLMRIIEDVAKAK
ncbi:MAG: SIR2 family protein [Dehalococcoidia bacterium]